MNATSLSFPGALLPDVPGLVLDDARCDDQELVLTLTTTAPEAPCPVCHQLSARIHSRYRRTPRDLPWGGRPARLVLNVRKFFCAAPSCPRRIFTERLPALVSPSARVTTRLADLVHAVALALGGEAGARLTGRIGITVSPATLIAAIRRTPPPAYETPRVLGVDDWAQRKGVRYGTALVDLERHQLVDLLPDREAETFAAWLRVRPGVQVIARDRGEAYATGARHGAPDAIQVADRWHLLSNWREAAERVLDRHRGSVKRVTLPKMSPAARPAAKTLPPKSVNRRRKYAEERRDRAREERLALYGVIRERHARGEYLTTIARDLGLNYKTARKYALADECPAPRAYPPRQRLLAPYEPYLRARWAEGCRNGSLLYREIATHGFRGNRSLVASFVAALRRAGGKGGPDALPDGPRVALTPHTAALLLLRRPEQCSDAEHAAIEQLRESQADVATAMAFTERFTRMVRERRGEDLGRWLADARTSGVREVAQFALKLQQDEAAVRAGCTLAWSNGQTEGHVNRLKLLKRQMYGRAQFDLLRRRALAA